MGNHEDFDVVIVGAGVSGLTCALELEKRGKKVCLLEAGDRVGGRIRTDEVEGFLLDRGFQVFLPAYPTAREYLDLEALELKAFTPGAVVQCEGERHRLTDPFRRPLDLSGHLLSKLPTQSDKWKVGELRNKGLSQTIQDVFESAEGSTLDLLVETGFSEKFRESFFRPFLAGIFLEEDLKTSGRFFRFIFKIFSECEASLPKRGMQAIPDQLAAKLNPETLRLNSRVVEIDNGVVRLESGERHRCDTVVVATNPTEATGFGANGEVPPTVGVTCLYFTAPVSPLLEPILLLNGDRTGGINNLAVVSDVAPTYSPDGRALISVSILGVSNEPDAHIEEAARAQLTDWFGASVAFWSLLRIYRIPHALPYLETLPDRVVRRKIQGRTNLFLCGDYLETGSIEGAMSSGKRVAQAIR
jgi:phytoene dehydrogenase-like protein